MLSQNARKQARIKRIGGSSLLGSHKRIIDRKTGSGFVDSLKGMLSKITGGLKPLIKSFLASDIPKDVIQSLTTKGAEAINKKLDGKMGQNEGRSKLVNTIANIGSKKVSEEATKLLNKYMGDGIKKKGKSKVNDKMMEIIKGQGLATL